MIHFEKLEATNFMAFRTLGLSFPAKGLFLIDGENRVDAKKSNGSGKSSIVEALAWGLFGETLRAVPSVDKVVRDGATDCTTIVQFVVDRERYRVQRTRRKGSATLALYKEEGGWEPISAPSAAKTQEAVEHILGMDFRAFCSAVAFGGSSAFKFSSLSDEGRRDVLEKAIGVDVYVTAAELAREDRRGAERALGTVSAQLSAIEAEISQREAAAAEAVAKFERGPDLSAVDDLRSEIAEMVAMEKKLSEKKEFAEDIDHLKAALRSADRALREAEANENKAAEAFTVAQRMARALEVRGEAECPTCLRPVTRADKAGVRQSVEEARARLDTTNLVSAEKRSIQVAAAGRLATHEAAARSLDARARRRTELERDLAKIEVQEAGAAAWGEVEKKERAAVVKLQAKARPLRERAEQLDTASKNFAYLAEVFGEKGLATAAIESALPALNEAAADVAAQVAGDDVSVTFSTSSETKSGKSRDKLTLEVSHRNGAKSYAASSEGEKAVVDLVAGMAIQQLVAGKARASVSFFDEVFDHMDEFAAERVVELLLAEAKTRAVFLVTHSPHVRDAAHFRGVYTAVKFSDGSIIRKDR